MILFLPMHQHWGTQNRRQFWRWFGSADRVSVDDMMQVENVVSVLHHVPTGSVLTAEAISKRQAQIATMVGGTASGLQWDAVESLPVSEDIKRQSGGCVTIWMRRC
jgi:mannonate dehydratase